MAVETKIFLSKKKKTIMSEYRSPLVEPEPQSEPDTTAVKSVVDVTEALVTEKDEIEPKESESQVSVESERESEESSESEEDFSDCESEDEIESDPRFFHSSVPCTHQVRTLRQ